MYFKIPTRTPQAIGSAAAETQQRRAPSTPAATVSRGQGLYCLVFCLLGECVCVWCPTTSGRCRAGLVQNPGIGQIGRHTGNRGAAELPGSAQKV